MQEIFHSVKLIEENCRGCTKCMISCPVEAVRVKNGKALIYKDRCIDCGECIRVCPYNAHIAQRNDLESLNGYKVKVAIPSVTLYSQFGGFVEPSLINEAVESIGFDEVFNMTYACDIVSEIIKKEIEKNRKPVISPFCPAIVRLIQTSYHDLLEHVVRVLSPIEVSASLIREKYLKAGFRNEDIGVFYLTPCVARLVKSDCTSFNRAAEINASIAISDIYPKLLKYISKNKQNEVKKPANLSFTGLSWSVIGGQSRSMGVKEYISVHGVENVIRLLDDIEKGKFSDVEYIEAFACTEGCLGGLMLVDNPFNARRIVRKYYNNLGFNSVEEGIGEKYKEQFSVDYHANKSFDPKFAGDFAGAVKKMNEMNKLINILPGIDCGLCGAPSCRAFAEDVIRGLSLTHECKMIKMGENENEG